MSAGLPVPSSHSTAFSRYPPQKCGFGTRRIFIVTFESEDFDRSSEEDSCEVSYIPQKAVKSSKRICKKSRKRSNSRDVMRESHLCECGSGFQTGNRSKRS